MAGQRVTGSPPAWVPGATRGEGLVYAVSGVVGVSRNSAWIKPASPGKRKLYSSRVGFSWWRHRKVRSIRSNLRKKTARMEGGVSRKYGSIVGLSPALQAASKAWQTCSTCEARSGGSD